MKSAKSLIKGGISLTVGQIGNQACSFIKSVILARLLTESDYGIAAVFALALSILEMTSNLAINTLIVQSREGDNPNFQDTAHSMQLSRGLISAAVLLVIARPIAIVFGIPHATWAFRLLALVPLIRGFYHLDLYRFQRQLKFEPFVGVQIGANVAGTAAALISGLWLQNYAAMIAVILVQAVVTLAASQILAIRKYQLSWHREYVRLVVSFGWPLMINGFLMYLILQGDQFAIGTAKQLFSRSTYSMKDLGIYSVAFSLTMTLASPIVSIASSLFLPLLSRVQEMREEFIKQYNLCTGVLYCIGGILVSIFVLNGGWIVTMIYGAKYRPASAYIAWLSCMWALRILRAGPTIAAMACGDSKNAMISNLLRSLSLIGVVAAAAIGAPIVWIPISGLAGEFVAFIACV